MMTPDPREIRYRDQHEAATEHAHRVRQSTREMMTSVLGTTFADADLGPVSHRLISQLWALAGTADGIQLCGHIDMGNPVPTYWTPGAAPETVNCAGCNAAATTSESLRADLEDDGAWNCDGCGQQHSRNTIGSGGILRVDTPPGIPPLTATILLCRACAVEEGVPGAGL